MSTADETRDQDGAERARQQVDHIEALCDRFEDAWKTGRGLSVGEYLRLLGLDAATAPPDLIDGLTSLESEYRAERFPPGTVLAGRYRIVAQLGKGGMGEVYRADDLTLGQPIALKFLPRHIANDPDRLARFRKEAATARKVSHPNVCRVYDIAQHEGQSFLTMGFIDGEDLSSVLKRIGRVSEEKGLEIARELCAALAAVHDEGLLHRDLKPANVMLDGRGKVRLTDFGLAGAIGSFTAAEAREGTLLYQAPEQLAGAEVNVRSDIYALGLVLYELFTGRRAYADVKREGSPSKPSTHVSGLNPAVERIILKCLELDPARRPQSATEVLAGLPGGDPLAAALAAGETPSPQVVAEAGGEGSLPPRVGLALFGLALVGAILAAWLNDYSALFRQMPTELSPRDLTRDARKRLENLGYGGTAAHSAHGISADEPLLKFLRDKHPELLRRAEMRSGQPAVEYFWLRQSPQPLAQRLAANDTSGWSMPGRVLPNEPPLRDPGMTCVFLDLKGRLLEFHAVPPREAADEAAREPDPKALLATAGFTEGSLRESKEFRRVPPVFADRQMAWEGAHPTAPNLPVRVEAAFYRGKSVYFHVGPDGHGDRLPNFMPGMMLEKLQEVLNMILGVIALPIGGWFAWRNWKQGSAHPTGAAVVAAAFVGLGVVGWVLAAKHVPRPDDELSMFTGVLGRALFDGFLLWLAYLALEPWVRRTRPEQLIAWNRILERKWRNPLVGRDVLLAVAVAAAFVAFLQISQILPAQFGRAPEYRLVWNATLTEGVGSLLITVQIGIMVALRHFFMYYLVRLVCRHERLTSVVIVVIWTALHQHSGNYLPVRWGAGAVFSVLSVLILLRGGLLAFIVFEVTFEVLMYLPVTTDFSAWYGGMSTLGLALVVSLAAYGFWAACRHRSFFADAVRD